MQRGPAPKRPSPDSDIGNAAIGTSVRPPPASNGESDQFPYRIRHEETCWALCKPKKHNGGYRWIAFNWFPKLEQACDRLAELCLGVGIEDRVLEIHELRRHVVDVKRKMTKEIVDRLIPK